MVLVICFTRDARLSDPIYLLIITSNCDVLVEHLCLHNILHMQVLFSCKYLGSVCV